MIQFMIVKLRLVIMIIVRKGRNRSDGGVSLMYIYDSLEIDIFKDPPISGLEAIPIHIRIKKPNS